MNAGNLAGQSQACLAHLPTRLSAETDFVEVIAALGAGKEVTVDGVWGSSCALVAAALAQHAPPAMLIVLPQLRQVDGLADDLALFGIDSVACLPVPDGELSELAADDTSAAQLLRTLGQLVARQDQLPRIVISSIQGLLSPLPDRQQLTAAASRLRVGDRLDADVWLGQLVLAGYTATSGVAAPAEFARRGGILDVFPRDAEQPIRIELMDDEIESIRCFDIASQRSVQSLNEVTITVLPLTARSQDSISSYLPPDSWVVMVEPDQLADSASQFLGRVSSPDSFHNLESLYASWHDHPRASLWTLAPSLAETSFALQVESVDRFRGDMDHIRQQLDQLEADTRVQLVCTSEGQQQRFEELLRGTATAERGNLQISGGDLGQGFHWVNHNTTVIGSADLLGQIARRRPSRRYQGKPIDSFLQIEAGDLVVHLAHGVGRYRGLELIDKEGIQQEHLAIEFRAGTRIYVPASRIELVQKYVGGRGLRPRLATIGSASWQRQKKAAQAAVQDMASELLELQARREARPGIQFPPDSLWQMEFEAAFPYRETPDQLTAIQEIRQDMTGPRPMDRLICGDVGYGKTELAMRAAFKAVDSGYQVAVLVPTTILAEQHYRTFKQRMAQFPIDVGRLSRFASLQEQREVVEGLGSGRIDIVIGTHRLASQDVSFQNLGLLVIDEEQRFGVEIKERLKTMRSIVDVLTLSATPIPRTLHMSMIGVRDISNLETPPEDRLAVETRLSRFQESMIREAILRELNRGGQIYFVHNRVQDIEQLAARLQTIVPEATVGIGHGQMPEGQLEGVMVDFIAHRFDLLVATTIVENGLDIPNANTIFIDEANRYGLADLHQLRGRVGRYKHRAYCYLLVNPRTSLTPTAARRLRAIEQYSQMGAGFAIAMQDLEIRGAGNLLGPQQSGHIATVGYELYCQLMETAVRALKKLPPRQAIEVEVSLPGSCHLPAEYLPGICERIDLYRRFARIDCQQTIDSLREEMQDRFGPPPAASERMLRVAELRLAANQWGISSISTEQQFLVFRYSRPAQIKQLVNNFPDKLRIVDGQSAYYPLPDNCSPEQVLATAELVLRPSAEPP